MNKDPISGEELFKRAIEIRNFEISLFWQRSNYFLVLNTAIAIGFFSNKTQPEYTLPLAAIGLTTAILWFLVNLGSKFWQSRWEHRLRLTESELGITGFFSADWDTIRDDVRESLRLANHSGMRRIVDRLVLTKPSVSLMMILLSLAAIILWIVFLIKATIPLTFELTMSRDALEWVKAVGTLLVSWPVVGLIIALMFRKAVLSLVQRFVASTDGKAELGPMKFEMGKLAEQGRVAVGNLQHLNLLMAESRLLELEITEANFGRVFTPEQRERMNLHIEELRRLTAASKAPLETTGE